MLFESPTSRDSLTRSTSVLVRFEFEDGDLVREAFELPQHGAREGEALFGTELAYSIRYEDLPTIGCLADPRREGDGRAEEVVVVVDGLASRDTDPDAQLGR